MITPSQVAAWDGILARPEYCRMVERRHVAHQATANYLFTSGKPNRYNPRGIEALYCSEDQATAGAEADRYRNGATKQGVIFWIHPRAFVLDLGNPVTVDALELQNELYAPWRFALSPTKTQILGGAIAGQTRLGGIRFPSDAAREKGFVGYNLVLFKRSIAAPHWVMIKDDTGGELQRWP